MMPSDQREVFTGWSDELGERERQSFATCRARIPFVPVHGRVHGERVR